MPAIKLLNIFALSTLAILLCAFAPSQTLAVSLQSNHLARQLPNHHGIVKKKRGTKRCKPRSSSLPPSSSPAPKPAGTPANNVQNTSPPKSDPSSSSTQPPNPVQTKTPTGTGKLAVAWALGEDKRFNLITAGKRTTMVHLWGAQIPDIVKKSGIPVSIMLWSAAQDRVNDFLKYAKPGYASYAYGFNEVNEPGQANMDVGSAVSAWYKYLRPLANQGYTLGSPCTSSNPNGYDWTKEFFKQCGSDCSVHEMSVHWYDVEFEDLKAYIDKWAGFNLPMRVTEFACQNFNGGAQPNSTHIWDFTTKAIDFFEGDSRVLSYAPFGFMDDMTNVADTNRLFVKDSEKLTDLGSKYVYGN